MITGWLGILPLAISGLALAVSMTTAWLTLFRRGTLRMTRPNVIYFGFDSTPNSPDPKVFLRCLLYSTAAKGQLIENLFVRLKHGETTQNFSIWVYGGTARLSRGSGLFVGRDGIATNHHFLMPKDQQSYVFRTGQYDLEVFANLVGKTRPMSLFKTQLSVTDEQERRLASKEAGVYFDWGAEAQRYSTYLDTRPVGVSFSEIEAMLPKLLPPKTTSKQNTRVRK